MRTVVLALLVVGLFPHLSNAEVFECIKSGESAGGVKIFKFEIDSAQTEKSSGDGRVSYAHSFADPKFQQSPVAFRRETSGLPRFTSQIRFEASAKKAISIVFDLFPTPLYEKYPDVLPPFQGILKVSYDRDEDRLYECRKSVSII